MITAKTKGKMIEKATTIQKKAYAPYSGFKVGASLLGKNGEIYTGCNIENISSGLTVCAERHAVFSAVSDGCQEFSVLVVISDSSPPVTPCGACRQVLAEFTKELRIILVNPEGEQSEFSLSRLLPEPFSGGSGNHEF